MDKDKLLDKKTSLLSPSESVRLSLTTREGEDGVSKMQIETLGPITETTLEEMEFCLEVLRKIVRGHDED